MRCPNCGTSIGGDPISVVPAEPPVGTRVRDRHGAVAMRYIDSDGNDGWGPGPGFYAFAKWEAMWAARGPLALV